MRNRPHDPREPRGRRGMGALNRLLYLIGACVCLIGLFYFILMLTR